MSHRFIVISSLGLGTWWMLSVFLHTTLFGLVAVLAPPSPPASSSEEFSMEVSPDRVREIAEVIREDERKQLAEKLSELIEIKENLDKLNSNKVQQYNQVMQDEASRAPELIAAAQAEALAAQEKALQAQQRAEQALERVNAASSEELAAEATREATEAQSEVKLAQSQVAAAQERMAHRLHLIEGWADALETLMTAAASQKEATTAQEEAESLANKISSGKKALKPAQEIAAKEIAVLEKREAQVAAALKTLAERKAALALAEDQRLISASNGESKEPTLEKARQQVTQAEERVAKSEEARAKQQLKTNEAIAKAEARGTALAAALAGSGGKQRESTTLQEDAMELQRNADAAISRIVENYSPETAQPLPKAEPKIVPSPERETNLGEMYERAQAAEQAIAETYRFGRAAELAAIRKIPLEEAIKLTEVAKPNRPSLDTSILSRDVADVKSVRDQEKAITSVSAQMESMLALARRMRELAKSSESDLSLATIQAKIAANDRMEQLAMEESGTRAKDLSGEMSGDGTHYSSNGDPNGVSAEMLGVSHAAAAWSLSPFDPKSLSDLATAMEVAALTRRGGGGGGLAGYASQGWGKGVPGGIANADPKDFRPIPGRTVRAGSVTIEEGRNPAWLYVDTWHLLGPWPNPRRKNLHTKFPPETVVDLDATYQGGRKDETPVPIRWQFYQLPARTAEAWTAGMVCPPGMRDFEIYYAYTELWFDHAMDLWVAIGSDDQSKVWLNDQLIWKSADYYKAWAPNEGLRKVHFRKGINRVLYRLENGQLGGGFSFLVCLSEPK